jgi:nucleotide-binding universal stress UspA family protein
LQKKVLEMPTRRQSLEDNHIEESPELRDLAEDLSRRWSEILEDYSLPCPLCRGELEMQGVAAARLYEFAEGEPGAVNPIELLPIHFLCGNCGYTAVFDSQLFNPAHLARLAGEKPERVAALTVRDYRVLLPLRGDERSNTILHLATAIAASRNGDILVLESASGEAMSERVAQKLQDYRPRAGSPATVNVIQRTNEPLRVNLTQAVTRHRCDLLLIEARGWHKGAGGRKAGGQSEVGPLIEEILLEDLCSVGIVHDRGLPQVNRVLLATSGGPNAQAAVSLVLDIVRAFEAELHVLYIASPADSESVAVGHSRIAETLGEIDAEGIRLQQRVIVEEDPVQGLISEAGEYDLLVIGGSPRDWRGKIQLNSFSATVARNADTTTIVLIAPGDQPRSFLSRLLGL